MAAMKASAHSANGIFAPASQALVACEPTHGSLVVSSTKEHSMEKNWKTLRQIAAEMGVTDADAQRIVDELHCPRVFRMHETVYLV